MVVSTPRIPIGGRRGRIITFYSYKGGTGRSMALANVAWILACNGRRVLAVDWDLEAPGLHRYFRPFLEDPDLSKSPGLIDLVDAYASAAVTPATTELNEEWYREYTNLGDYIAPVRFDHYGNGGGIDLLPAGRQNAAYSIAVNSFEWSNFFDRLGGGGFIEGIKHYARERYDYILVDSRTGVTDTAGICSVQMPESLVVCFTYNNQSLRGGAAMARAAVRMRRRLVEELSVKRTTPLDGGLSTIGSEYRIFPVPMRADDGESDKLKRWQMRARKEFAGLTHHIENVPGLANVKQYWHDVEVPHSAFYSYEEILAAFKDEPLNQRSVLASFVSLTKYLTDGDVTDAGELAPARIKEECLQAFGETSIDEARALDVDPRDESMGLARRLDRAIAMLTGSERKLAWSCLSRLVWLDPDEEDRYFPIQPRLNEFPEKGREIVLKLTPTPVEVVPKRAGAALDASAMDDRLAFAKAQLLDQWKTLQEYLGRDRAFLLWRQELSDRIRQWEASGRERRALLSDRSLTNATFWINGRHDDLNTAEKAFIEASRTSAWTWWKKVIGAITAIAVATAIIWLLKSPRISPSDAVVAHAAEDIDPLKKALLLLELGRTFEASNEAKKIAVDLTATPLPWAVFYASRPSVATAGHFDSDGSAIVMGSSNGSVQIWRGSASIGIGTSSGAVLSISLDGVNARLLAIGTNHVAELWDLNLQKRLGFVNLVSQFSVGTLQGGSPVIVLAQGLVRLDWQKDNGTWRPTRLFELPSDTTSVSFGNNGTSAAVLTVNDLSVIGLADGKKEFSQVIHSPSKALLSPDGRFVGALNDVELRVWETSSGRQVGAIQRSVLSLGTEAVPGHIVGAMALSPDGETIAIGYVDGLVRVFKLSDAAIPDRTAVGVASLTAPTLQGHKGLIRDLAFSPDGMYIVTAGDDATWRVWHNPYGTVTQGLATSNAWSTVWDTLRDKTTACLNVEDRTALLNESISEARSQYDACQTQYGPKRLQITTDANSK